MGAGAAAAASGSAAPLGNVVLSRPFQFVMVETASSAMMDGELVWMPKTVKAFAPVKDRWIYAFELGLRDGEQKPILAAEFEADKDGKLGFVPGLKRRAVEPKAAPKPARVPAAALPLVRQGKRLRYAFVAIQGRLGKAAIADMEDWLHPIYERKNLAEDFYFKVDKGVSFVSVVDPLTITQNLSAAYHKALDEANDYLLTTKENPKQEEVEIRARKHQLARMIKDSLLEPGGHATDPLDIRKHLANDGHTLLNFISDHESTVRRLDGRRRSAARELVRMLNSRVLIGAYGWYLGTKQAANEIGHFWLSATFSSLYRLSETPEGKALLQELVRDEAKGLLSYLFVPEVEHEAESPYKERFPIMRKAATAAVLGIAELAPALVVYGKVRAANKRIIRTISAFLKKTTIVTTVRAHRGAVVRTFKHTTVSVHVEISYRHAKADLKEWVDEGKPHWPEGTKQAEVSELLSHLFVGVEILNLYNCFSEMLETFTKQSAAEGTEDKDKLIAVGELFGAGLDVTVALEDPIRAGAKHLDSLYHPPGAGAEAAAVAEGEAEAAGFFQKLARPAVFKGLGAVSAAIDAAVYFIEAGEAKHKGDHRLATAKYVVAAGSALILGASIMNIAGYMLGSAALTAAAASFLVIGVAVVAIGYALVAYFSRSAWQKFAERCSFGVLPAAAGHENWSGGSFAEWTESKEGFDRQIQVLTAMFCAFKVSGVGTDAQTITVSLSATPPGAKLEIAFTIAYQNGPTRKPEYVIDLENGHLECGGDVTPARQYEPYWVDEKLHSVLLMADRPESLEHARVAKSSCAVVMRYARHTAKEKVLTGTIPIAGECKYEIYNGEGMARFDQLSTLELKGSEE